MTALSGIRGPVALGMIALLLLAALVPVCLMSPATAMAMPADNARARDCDRGEDSLSSCPYAEQNDRAATVSAPDLGQSFAVPSGGIALVTSDADFLQAPLVPGGAPPLAASTPLRL